ncbi:MAG: GC-type dockerin domain-anchored protein [Phycisphaerales bacterium]
MSFSQAAALAAAMAFNGATGHLATLDGPDPVAEQSWVLTNVVRTASLPNPTQESLYWFGASRPSASGSWTWNGGAPVPPALISTWWVDVAEGAGTYGVVFANNYPANYGDYRQDDPALRMRGFVVEFDTAAGCGPADLGITGGLPGHDGALDNNDFIAFINYFFNQDPTADMGVAGGLPGHDGQLDNNDFVAFISAFFAGC